MLNSTRRRLKSLKKQEKVSREVDILNPSSSTDKKIAKLTQRLLISSTLDTFLLASQADQARADVLMGTSLKARS